MTTRLLTLALVAALALPVHADQSTRPATSPVASAPGAKAVARPVLWKVSDADNSVYLLGSFHLLKRDDYPMPVEIDRAFDDAESLLFEIDPREMTAPETVATMQKYMAYEEGKSLSKVLPKATLERLGTLVSASGGSVQALEQSEPWAVSLGLVLGVSQAMGLQAAIQGLPVQPARRRFAKPLQALHHARSHLLVQPGALGARQLAPASRGDGVHAWYCVGVFGGGFHRAGGVGV